MKKIVLSSLAALTLGTVAATAGELKFYQDEVGQVFTTPAEGRTEIKASADTPVFAKSSKLQFSGKHYLGFTSKKLDSSNTANYADDTTNLFEARRNYVQVKAYLLEDPKSYFRFTLDTTYDGEGKAELYTKYAYLYLNDVLPHTGVEVGMVHRPWHDYEQNNGWNMRSIAKIFIEGTTGFGSSADMGFNFKTKTDYFTSEIGVFNGEGYKGDEGLNAAAEVTRVGDGLSAEWRLTGAFMGNGKKKRKATKDTYLDASFFGQFNTNNTNNTGETYKWYGLHAVYNTPTFLVAGQYVTANNDLANEDAFNGQGYAFNGTFRMGDKKEYSAFARFDKWENEDSTTSVVASTEEKLIYGVAWQQNKNVKWLLNGENYNIKESDSKDYKALMVTAEVKW